MRKSQILWGFFVAFGLLSVALASTGSFQNLWVFPLDAAGLPLWMAVCALDALLASLPYPRLAKLRVMLWCGGLLLFTARQGVPGLGLALVAGAALLWTAAAKGAKNLVPAVAGIAAVLFLFGHGQELLYAGMEMEERLPDFRFSLRLLSAFALFRMLSWAHAVAARRERPSFFDTMEYFLAPAFWLSPMHAAHLVFARMRCPREPLPARIPAGWIARGFVHALLFSSVLGLAMPWLHERFEEGASAFRWWEWLALGPLLFVITYLEKSRVSYVVAGLLSLSGRDVPPDFHAPWLARSLPAYWRRFHSWLWEYYMDYIYIPLSASLLRRFSPKTAGRLALFLTFSLGTTLVHWVHYPAPLHAALALGTLFGALTVLHALAGPRLERSPLGIPATWLSVFFLYIAAYPVYGLGWGLPELLDFFRK